jgi:DNA phosphorothioation-dependent restriction protein DptF
MHLLSPLNLGRSKDIDQLTIELNTLKDVESVVLKHIRSEKGLELLKPLALDSDLDHSPFMKFSETVITVAYLTNEEFFKKVSDHTYQKYLSSLYGMNTSNMDVIKEIFNDVKNAIFKWKGSPRRDCLYITSEQNSQHSSYRLAQKLILKPANIKKENTLVTGNKLDRFLDRLSVNYYLGDSKDTVTLEIDYFLFKLIHIVNGGYVPNRQDYDEAIKFVEFMETLMKYGSKQSDLLLNVANENKLFSFRMDDFNGFTFESEETQ